VRECECECESATAIVCVCVRERENVCVFECESCGVSTTCKLLQCVAVRCSALQCIAVRCSALQCVAVRCSALQCVVCCMCIHRRRPMFYDQVQCDLSHWCCNTSVCLNFKEKKALYKDTAPQRGWSLRKKGTKKFLSFWYPIQGPGRMAHALQADTGDSMS